PRARARAHLRGADVPRRRRAGLAAARPDPPGSGQRAARPRARLRVRSSCRALVSDVKWIARADGLARAGDERDPRRRGALPRAAPRLELPSRGRRARAVAGAVSATQRMQLDERYLHVALDTRGTLA